MKIVSRQVRRQRMRTMPAYLLMACASELGELRMLLDTLPMCAYGRIMVIADGLESDAALDDLAVPMRMIVSAFGSGEACERAAKAWASEMLCDADAIFQGWCSARTMHIAESLRAECPEFAPKISAGAIF